ncbi:MAG: 16S rRNA (cytosine(967)-C(5))-methyltransferase RsmB [Acidobacteriota bacterium]|nr:16S rRNA (cytosine(967)-C(5))-methyltransferase RsmB [Acidobacteriota bacterium]
MKISPARIAAFEILSKIESETAFSSVLLPLYATLLSPPDRALCHQLTLGILRKQMYLDCVIGNFGKGKKIDPAVRIALRIGLYQLLFLDRIPDYSAINDSVNLVQYAKKTSAKGFVNAILRRATRENISCEYADDIERISVEASHPRWLIEKWIGRFGVAETERLAHSNNEISEITFRFTARSSQKIREKFLNNWNEQKTVSVVKMSEFVEDCFIADDIDTELLDLVENGEIYFQDEASQMVAVSIDIRSGDKFLDVCAAPGSKTTLIAGREMMKTETVVAGDLHWPRASFLRDNCRNQGVGFVHVLQYDAESELPFANESFDVVLLDAPCSGTGTIRHNPEIRYSLKPSDLAGLSQKQLTLLQNASKAVKQGGRLIYSTCSLETEENEQICEKFIADNPRFSMIKPRVPERFMNADGFAQTLPHRDNMDGFFIAAFEKVHQT